MGACATPELQDAQRSHCPSRCAGTSSTSLQRGSWKTYQRVLLPVSVALSYSGSEGTTVGMGATELEASRLEVCVAKASTGSTIMVAA